MECVSWYISFFVPTRISTMVSKSFRCARFFLDVMLTWAVQPLGDIMVVQLFSKMDGLFLLLDLQYTETYLHRPHKSERYGLRVDHRRRSSAKLAPKSQPRMSMRMRNDDHSTRSSSQVRHFQTCSIRDPLTPWMPKANGACAHHVMVSSTLDLSTERLDWVAIDHLHNYCLGYLETGHPVTVGQSPARESHSEQTEMETRKTAFYSSETLISYAGDWPTVTECPVSNPGYNCANGLFCVNVDGTRTSPLDKKRK